MRILRRIADALDRLIGALCAAGMFLVVPIALLLFLQWPLREVVHAWSREANDTAQVLFALYVAVAMVHATRRRAHLATDIAVGAQSPARRELLGRLAGICVLLPWSLFVLQVAAPMIWRSATQTEHFPDTDSPGYFVVWGAVGLFVLLTALQAMVDVVRGDRR